MTEVIKASDSSSLSNFIWKRADEFWVDFKHYDFVGIIVPLLLSDHHATLVSAAVTGKIDVRAAAPTPSDQSQPQESAHAYWRRQRLY